MRLRSFLACVGASALVAAAAIGQDKTAEKANPAAMDPKAMMEVMQKAATPGDAHKKLEPLVGTWDAKVSMWMAPGQPPQESTGTSETAWVLGGRFLETKHQGTFMGQPFSGIGYTGYDNVAKKYIGTWMDTLGTGMMSSSGNMSGKSMKMTASMTDPMTGKVARSTETFTIVDNDHNKMEMWDKGPDGKPVKVMQIDYTRKK